MRNLHEGLRKDHHLKHFGRLQYGLFIKVGCTIYIILYKAWLYYSYYYKKSNFITTKLRLFHFLQYVFRMFLINFKLIVDVKCPFATLIHIDNIPTFINMLWSVPTLVTG